MKILFYLSSLLVTVLILLVNPSKNNNFTYQSKVFNFRSNHLFIYQVIGLSVSIFFVSIVSLLL
uniref:Preprotein-translocase subunit g n=1 Tax=Chondria sp. (in: red algae) TaxID=1982705 RepID=A0A1Z1MCC3_9FLOR|nr:preprotein-translocase subunit g [Chondria sp. (in: red algae)]